MTVLSIFHIQMGQHMRFWHLSHMHKCLLETSMLKFPVGLEVLILASLYQHPYFVYMRCEGSGETVCMCRLVEPSLLAYMISTKFHVWAQKIF